MEKATQPITYFLYCRKSSEAEDRQILSIESQKRELLNCAEKENLKIIDIIEEEKSAHHPGREKFDDMMARIKKGEANGLLVWHANRLSRNPVDSGQVIYSIDIGNIVEVRTPSRSFINNPDDKFMLSLEFGMSKKDSDDKSINVKNGLKTKLNMGWRPGVSPLGYLNNKLKEKGEKDIIKDSDRFDLVRKMWNLMLTGKYTAPGIVKIANNEWGFRTRQMKKQGGKPLCKTILYSIFTNPFYYGWFNYQGQLWKGAHEPMITEEEFDRVQTLLGRKGRPRPKKYNFLYTGLMRCGECGCSITADQKDQIICSKCKHKFSYKNRHECPKCGISIQEMENPKILRYLYYHCTKKRTAKCSQGSIEVAKLEQQFDKSLSRIEIDEEYKDVAIEHLNKTHNQEAEYRGNILKSKQKDYEDCIKRIDNLIRIKISLENKDGALLSDEEFKDQKNKILKEKALLEEILNDTGQRAEKWLELSERAFNFARYARYWFKNGSPEEKRQIFTALGSNIIVKDKKLVITLRKPFKIIEDGLKKAMVTKPQLIRFEPKNFRVNKAKVATFEGDFALWLRG